MIFTYRTPRYSTLHHCSKCPTLTFLWYFYLVFFPTNSERTPHAKKTPKHLHKLLLLGQTHFLLSSRNHKATQADLTTLPVPLRQDHNSLLGSWRRKQAQKATETLARSHLTSARFGGPFFCDPISYLTSTVPSVNEMTLDGSEPNIPTNSKTYHVLNFLLPSSRGRDRGSHIYS